MKNHKTLINNLSRETALLESLEWDYDKLDELYELLDVHFQGDSIISPPILLSEVLKKFGEDCAKALQQIFVEVSFVNGFFLHDPDIEN
jgi:hypothetical protein